MYEAFRTAEQVLTEKARCETFGFEQQLTGERTEMPWYKVTVSYGGKEAGAIEDAFGTAFIAHNAPQGAALFSRSSNDLKRVDYYFTPAAWVIASGMIAHYGGEPCEVPANDDKIALIVGEADAKKMLA